MRASFLLAAKCVAPGLKKIRMEDLEATCYKDALLDTSLSEAVGGFV